MNGEGFFFVGLSIFCCPSKQYYFFKSEAIELYLKSKMLHSTSRIHWICTGSEELITREFSLERSGLYRFCFYRHFLQFTGVLFCPRTAPQRTRLELMCRKMAAPPWLGPFLFPHWQLTVRFLIRLLMEGVRLGRITNVPFMSGLMLKI